MIEPIKSLPPSQTFDHTRALCSALCSSYPRRPADLGDEPPPDGCIGGGAGAAAGGVRVVRGGAELQRHLQLRRLDHGHGQPVHRRQDTADHLHAAALRRDLLRLPDLPLLRRPRRRRLPQYVKSSADLPSLATFLISRSNQIKHAVAIHIYSSL
jgi:hypothetical protein